MGSWPGSAYTPGNVLEIHIFLPTARPGELWSWAAPPVAVVLGYIPGSLGCHNAAGGTGGLTQG